MPAQRYRLRTVLPFPQQYAKKQVRCLGRPKPRSALMHIDYVAYPFSVPYLTQQDLRRLCYGSGRVNPTRQPPDANQARQPNPRAPLGEQGDYRGDQGTHHEQASWGWREAKRSAQLNVG